MCVGSLGTLDSLDRGGGTHFGNPNLRKKPLLKKGSLNHIGILAIVWGF